MEVLFVCTGNTCRSPMAEALLDDEICRAAKAACFTATSAGLAAFGGEPASDYAKQVMRGRGIGLGNHRAALLTEEALVRADLILTMTERHKTAIAYAFSAMQAKLYSLGEYTGTFQDIIDPFGSDYKTYEACAAMLAEQIELLWNKLNVGREMNK